MELCEFFEGHEKAGTEALLPPGVYTLADLRAYGRKKGWCPYFLARHMMAFANVVVYNYQYMIDPKVSQMVGGVLLLCALQVSVCVSLWWRTTVPLHDRPQSVTDGEWLWCID